MDVADSVATAAIVVVLMLMSTVCADAGVVTVGADWEADGGDFDSTCALADATDGVVALVSDGTSITMCEHSVSLGFGLR